MYIPRFQFKKLKTLSSKKVTIIYGPRRVGKTTLLKKFLEKEKNYLFVTGEDVFVSNFLSSQSIEKLKNYIGEKSLLVIDEAQYIPSIGKSLKLIIDHIENVRVIVTGSSSFDLIKQIGEPLTGRQHIIQLFPISQLELKQIENLAETNSRLEERLIYGSYPETLTLKENLFKQEYLHELVSSYLIKDILAFEGIKKSKKMLDLLILLAFQIGKEVSHTELGSQLSMNKNTVERYLDLLEKAFVLINIRGFSRNLRKEVTKTSRYYFYDNGIRNVLINNFNSLDRRDDIGILWENYLVIERIKKQHYLSIWSNNYFWRTYDQKEIDWVEEREGQLYGYEFKWKKNKIKPPKLWLETYKNATFDCISKNNYLKFIT
ncbi:MAG: ATP-binding protein [Candidatus Thorarchaeota archaeon]